MPKVARRRRLLDPDPPPLSLPENVTEQWLVEWFEYGFQLLCGLLGKYAGFADYLDHAQPDDPALD